MSCPATLHCIERMAADTRFNEAAAALVPKNASVEPDLVAAAQVRHLSPEVP